MTLHFVQYFLLIELQFLSLNGRIVLKVSPLNVVYINLCHIDARAVSYGLPFLLT